MLGLFGNKETLEETIIKKPFNLKDVEKKLSKLNYDKKNSTLIHLCAEKNCSEALAYLISKGFDINSLNAKSENALFTALNYKSTDAARVLINNSINVNQKSVDSIIPLHLALKNDHHNLIDSIINKTEDLTIKDKKGRSALFYVMESKNKDLIDKTFSLFPNLNLNEQDIDQKTISHLKEITASPEILEILIESGLDINYENKKGEDFLFLNCDDLELSNDIFELALRSNVNLNKKYTLKGITLLMKMVKALLSYDIQILENKTFINAYQERIQLFIEFGANPSLVNNDDENILFDIVREKNDINLDFILNRNELNVNQLNRFKQTVLDIAIFNEKPNLDVLRRLLFTDINPSVKARDDFSVIEKLIDIILTETMVTRVRKIPKARIFPNVNYTQILTLMLDSNKSDINKLTFDNEPLIFEVAKSFNIIVLELLKKAGMSLDVIDERDNLNIFYKVLEVGKHRKEDKPQFIKTLNYLLLNNISLDHKDSFGGNVMHKAILDHDLSVINILIKRVADISSVDNKGRTYIHNTVWNSKVDILKKVALKDRSLINKPDRYGILPINYAVIMGRKDMVFALVKLGAFLNNPFKINEQFKVSFFNKLGNLDDILNTSMNVNERNVLLKLINNMKEEFVVRNSS